MNHTLAQELKAAGFTVALGRIGAFFYKNSVGELEVQDSTGVYDGNPDITIIPHFQEVIDACGDDFRSLIKRDGGWEAHSRMYKDEDNVTQVDEWIAPTALEVVSRLFIAIKKRTTPKVK